MSGSQTSMSRRRAASILWFPIFFAIALPVTFLVAFHLPTPHKDPIAVVGSPNQARLITNELRRVSANGFDVRQSPSTATAAAAVRDREADAAYVAGSTSTVYVARAASAIRANYLQATFAQIAAETGKQHPATVDVAPLDSGDGGTGIFFFLFPLMMIGLITAIVLVQLPTWGMGRRVAVVAGVGAIGALATYLTAVDLNVLPGKPLLLLYAFGLTQVYGQLMVGVAPLLKQFFLPVSLTSALILSVPSSGGTVTPDLLPAFFRDLSYVMPLSQSVKVTRSVAYFHNVGIAQATLVLGLWMAVATAAVAIAWLRQSHARLPQAQKASLTRTMPARAAQALTPHAN